MKGIEATAKKNRRLYKKTLKSDCTEQDIMIYKAHRNMLNQLQRSTMMEYYNSKYTEYRQNTKKLWGLINQTIKKCKNGGSIIPYICVNGLQTYNSSEIANTFGKYYASLGNNLASTIKITWTTHIDHIHKKLMTNKMLLKSSCNMLTIDCLKSVYYAHIYSHLTYGLISWGPMVRKSAVNDLSWIQDACIRIVCKTSKWASVNALYKQLQTLQFPELITLELAKYGYKISSRLYSSKIHELAESNGGLK